MINYTAIKQIAAEQGLSVTELCALAPKNDPFYTGRPSEVAAAQWFRDLWQQFGYDRGVHLRRVHYRIVSASPQIARPDGTVYENTQRDWDYLNEASKWARYLRLVPPSSFVDRRNPEAVIHARWNKPGDFLYEDPAPRYSLAGGWAEDDYFLPELPELPSLPDELPDPPRFEVEGYHDGIQQDFHVEIWCEKTTMNDILLPLCEAYNLNLITGAGEMSITAVVEFLQRVRRAERPARIIYISDFDPAGLGMPISVARKIEYFQRNEGFHTLNIRLNPLALTAGQVAVHSLPRVPVKDTDLRKGSFEAAYGEGQVELDALEALYPGELARLVEDAILNYYDPTLRRRARDQREELEAALEEERERIIEEDYSDDLNYLYADYGELLTDFAATQARFTELIQQFQPEIDAHHDRLEEIKARGRQLYGLLSTNLARIAVNLNDYPLPKPELPPEPDTWLYDSRRDYIAQLMAYKAQRLGQNGHTGDNA